MSVCVALLRLEDERGDVVAGQAQEQVGVHELALVAHALVLIQGRKRHAAVWCPMP